jgi:hypothetical protein
MRYELQNKTLANYELLFTLFVNKMRDLFTLADFELEKRFFF